MRPKPREWFLSVLFSTVAISLIPTTVWPHSGGLDSYGCHNDRKLGGYHCHRGEFADKSFTSKAEMLASRRESYTSVPPQLSIIHFSGNVVSVIDGDTLDVLHDGKAERIRLNGIDCPEKGQAFGNRAKQATSDLVFGKEATVTSHGQDKYKRTIGDVKLADGRMLNQELVRIGICWWYRKYAPGDTTLERLEFEAKTAKRGLWVDPNPIPPWEWRKLVHKKP